MAEQVQASRVGCEGSYVGERVVVVREAAHHQLVVGYVNARGRRVGRLLCVPASEVR